MKKLFKIILLAAAAVMASGGLTAAKAQQTPVLFSSQNMGGLSGTAGILIIPDTYANPLWYGTNLNQTQPFRITPVNGQVITNLNPWGYTIRVDGWPRGVHIIVPASTNTLNVVTLINTNQFSPLVVNQYSITSNNVVSAGTNIFVTITNGAQTFNVPSTAFDAFGAAAAAISALLGASNTYTGAFIGNDAGATNYPGITDAATTRTLQMPGGSNAKIIIDATTGTRTYDSAGNLQETVSPAGITAATAFNGPGTGLTGLPAGQLTGTEPLGVVNPNVVTNTGPFNAENATNYYQTNLITDATVISFIDTGASAPSPSANWSAYFMDANCTNFNLIGTYAPLYGPSFAFGAFFGNPYIQGGTGGPNGIPGYNGAISFGIDGYSCVVCLDGDGENVGVFVNGVWTGKSILVPNDGGVHYDLITFATPSKRTVLLENSFPINSVYLPVTNTLFPSIAPHQRIAIMGDSYVAEDGYAAMGGCGMISQLQAMRPDLNIIGLGEEGTGFYNPSGSGLTNFLGRVHDVVACNPQELLIFGSINDQTFATSIALSNPVYVNCTNVLTQLRMKLPNIPIILAGPQAASTVTVGANPDYYNLAYLYSNACAAVGGVTYVNPLLNPWITGTWNVANSGNAVQYVYSDGIHYTIPLGAVYYADQLNSILSSNLSAAFPTDKRQMVFTNSANIFGGTFELYSTAYPGPVASGTSRLWLSNTVLYNITPKGTNFICGP